MRVGRKKVKYDGCWGLGACNPARPPPPCHGNAQSPGCIFFFFNLHMRGISTGQSDLARSHSPHPVIPGVYYRGIGDFLPYGSISYMIGKVSLRTLPLLSDGCRAHMPTTPPPPPSPPLPWSTGTPVLIYDHTPGVWRSAYDTKGRRGSMT